MITAQLFIGDVDPINAIFEACDTQKDQKLSLKGIQGNAKCLNMLDNLFGLKNITIADDFSMIDKDQDGFVTKEEGYGALPGHNAAPKTLDRLRRCHANFGGHMYEKGKSPRSCQKCMQYRACRDAANQGKIVLCQCENGKCEVHECTWGDCGKFGTTLKYVCEATP